MRRLGVSLVDVVAIVGTAMLGVGVGVRLGWDAALMMIGGLLLVYAVAVAAARREEGTQ